MELIAELPEEASTTRSSFEPFFAAHFRGVARAAALIAGDLASGQDLAQEAFLRVYARWDALSSDDHARNFTYQVAVRLARSHVRKHLRLVTGNVGRHDSAVAAPGEDRPDIVAALAKLPHRQRACVVLVDLVGMDSAAAGRSLGISANTVRVHVMRGRDALRRALGVPASEVGSDEA